MTQGTPIPTKHTINWRAKQVTVVSLTGLYEVGKGFVVGSVLQQIQEEKEATGSAEPLCFIVVDELNRYAPREGWSPIRERLLEIAERGRSSGTILIGAQQTASEVERRIVANPAFRIVGRLDAAEAERAEYGFLTPSLRRAGKDSDFRPDDRFSTGYSDARTSVFSYARVGHTRGGSRDAATKLKVSKSEAQLMRFLHTSDWHVGRTIRNHSRSRGTPGRLCRNHRHRQARNRSMPCS